MHYFVYILAVQSSWRRKESWLLCYYICIVLQMYCFYKYSVALPHGYVGWSAVCDLVFPDHSHFLIKTLMQNKKVTKILNYKFQVIISQWILSFWKFNLLSIQFRIKKPPKHSQYQYRLNLFLSFTKSTIFSWSIHKTANAFTMKSTTLLVILFMYSYVWLCGVIEPKWLPSLAVIFKKKSSRNMMCRGSGRATPLLTSVVCYSFSRLIFSSVCAYTYVGLVARKPVLGVSNKVRFKLACSATATS